jgi:SAM-dependent methyltransferase
MKPVKGAAIGAGYHLEELAIARAADDARRIMPTIPPGCRRIVDVGCGMGQTLIASDLADAIACGVEPDVGVLRLGRQIDGRIHLIGGHAERLPVRDDWAQFAIARLSLPYTDVPAAVREIHRVLEPGGELWAVLHPVSTAWEGLVAGMGSFRLRTVIYRLYVVLNGLLLHFAGRQFRYPLNRARCESFQTAGGMTRVLLAAGFQDVTVARAPGLIMTARKPATRHPG